MTTQPTGVAVLDEVRQVDLKTSGADLLEYVSGRAVPYNYTTDIGPFTEEFAPGAFTDSLRVSSKLPLLTFHNDAQFPMGVAERWHEREDGLHAQWRLGGSEDAQRAAMLVKEGMLNFLSIRFAPDELSAQWKLGRNGVKDHVRWTKARLIEVSLVSTPAYPTAEVTGIRSITPPRPEGPTVADWQNYLDQIKAGPQ